MWRLHALTSHSIFWKVGTIWAAAACWYYLVLHAVWEVDSSVSDRAELYIVLLFGLQWEDGDGMGQVSNTNRQRRKVNENLQCACREAGSAVRGCVIMPHTPS